MRKLIQLLLVTTVSPHPDQDASIDEDAAVGGAVNYADHVKAIMDGNCIGCHSSSLGGKDRNGAPRGVDLDKYQGAAASSEKSAARIQAGLMPPSGPLSEADKSTFMDWVADGLLENGEEK